MEYWRKEGGAEGLLGHRRCRCTGMIERSYSTGDRDDDYGLPSRVSLAFFDGLIHE